MSLEERHISQLVQNLVDRFNYLGEDKFELVQELSDLRNPVTRETLTPEDVQNVETIFLSRIHYKKSHDTARIIPISIVQDPRLHEEWYNDWLQANNDYVNSYYWKRLEAYLELELIRKNGPEVAGKIVRTIGDATHDIMHKLANPNRSTFSYKGLVIGYVQSGKTGNFTALIAKAIDAGYKFIIVLAGIHNVLRKQTQVRLDKELTGENDLAIDNFISLPSDAKRWNRITTAQNDFTTSNISPFSTYCQVHTPTLAIVKKNVRILNRLVDYISETPAENRNNIPVLIIDDEADQASIDTNANDPDTNPSRTNECIRRILRLFQQKTYIGYTATPFANVLIDMNTEHPELEDDLYPRNFIVSLPEPEGYFGAARIFRSGLSDKFVVEINDEANELIGKIKMTENLSCAIDQFILSCAVRNLRGDKSKPMSMLVHVSHRIDDMTIIFEIITRYISVIKARYNNATQNQDLKNEFNEVWEKFKRSCEVINTELHLTNLIPTFDEVWAEILYVFQVLSVVELNSSSDDRLDYTNVEELKVIAIGGNQLSRGLTLEGLMTSYYLRSSKQYDTLLQMGRWFGYRQGYEDLTRIHTTVQIWEFFEHIALVEEELRSEVSRYEEENKTPAELALAIRDHRLLKITSKNKMGAAQSKQISYSESINQTIWLPLDDPIKLTRNLELGEALIQKINNEIGFINNNGVYLSNGKVNGELVLREFLNLYEFVEKDNITGAGLDYNRLLQYIFRRLDNPNPELQEWSIAVVGNAQPNPEIPAFNFGGLNINRIQRSRKYTDHGFDIGVLTEPAHLKIDLSPNASSPFDGRTAQNPLLILYPIWHGSKAAKFIENPLLGQRIDLYRNINTEKIDALGVAIILPKSEYEPNNYVGQQ